jgi:hypothetical protein
MHSGAEDGYGISHGTAPSGIPLMDGCAGVASAATGFQRQTS